MRLAHAEALALALMKEHGLTDGSNLPSHGWIFQFDNARRRFGHCSSVLHRTISLSRYLTELNEEQQVRSTILHEIAHALDMVNRGFSRHDDEWRRIAVGIGDDGGRCYGEEVVTPERKYTGTCPKCERTVRRHRRGIVACGRCCKGKYDPAFNFIWS